MRRTFLALAATLMAISSTGLRAQDAQVETYGGGANRFSLATGSPGELGLLKLLAETFASRADAQMVWHKAGTGQSMKLLKEKKVDMVMVHAPGQEESAVAEGWATQRTLIGSNEFYIVGPSADPAKIAAASSAADAYRRIAAAQAKFVSRGDNSGTHQKEMSVWKSAAVVPEGAWYIVTKAFMTASLKRADAEGAYFMTDSSTWVAAKNDVPQLKVLFRGDKALVNTYSAMLATGGTPGEATARRFIDFVASAEAQRIIRDYGRDRYDGPLYNDAEYARQYAH
jgi:tungstate transport system substrate-binding protein